MPKTATLERVNALDPALVGLLSDFTGVDLTGTATIDTPGLVERLTSPAFGKWFQQVASVGDCERPIRLRLAGEFDARTGEIAADNTDHLPDGVIYKRCGTRRESLCASCAKLYRYDTYQLIKAGLVGGKGVDETIAEHPAVFVTLAAPSFGPVHSRIVKRHICRTRSECACRAEPCHARRDQPRCPHGKPLYCFTRHGADAKQVGKPLCLDCYDHTHHAVWNGFVTDLWTRTTTAINRAIAKIAGVHRDYIRVHFGKVAEFQQRGAVHLHAIMRLDGRDPAQPDRILAPPPGVGIPELTEAIEQATAATAIRTPPHPDNPTGWLIAWGDQGKNRHADIQAIKRGLPGNHISERKAAGYVAKYATKGAEPAGMPTSRRLTSQTIGYYADIGGTHTERLVNAAWMTAQTAKHHHATQTKTRTAKESKDRSPEDAVRRQNESTGRESRPEDPYGRLERGAHMLGFAGHFSTKSRKYSTTLGALRAARTPAAQAAAITTATAAKREETAAVAVNNTARRWTYIASGWHTTTDAHLANQSAAAARARRPAHLTHH